MIVDYPARLFDVALDDSAYARLFAYMTGRLAYSQIKRYSESGTTYKEDMVVNCGKMQTNQKSIMQEVILIEIFYN